MPFSQIILYLIDDDPGVRRSLARLFSSAGIQWQAFASADEFFAAAPHVSRGCVVTDVTMPGLSGIDLLRHLKAENSPLPVILLTAHDTEEMRQTAREAGAAAFFRKPVDAQALLDAIAWAVSHAPPGAA
jgi:FixJ family two-component response regulator